MTLFISTLANTGFRRFLNSKQERPLAGNDKMQDMTKSNINARKYWKNIISSFHQESFILTSQVGRQFRLVLFYPLVLAPSMVCKANHPYRVHKFLINRFVDAQSVLRNQVY